MSAQTAGRFKIEASEGGWPVWVAIYYDGKLEVHGMSLDDLTDLRYCADRILSKTSNQTQHKAE